MTGLDRAFAMAALITVASVVAPRRCSAEDGSSQPRVLEAFDIPNDGYSLLVPVIIGGKTYRFIIDTGCAVNLFDRSLKPLLGSSRGSMIMRTLRTRAELELFSAPKATLGALSISFKTARGAAEAGCADLRIYQIGAGDEVQGILGIAFLNDHVIQIDFDSSTIRFLSGVGPNPGVRLPLEFQYGVPYVRAEIGANIGARFVLDTGFIGGNGSLSAELVKQLADRRLAKLISATETALTGDLQGVTTSRDYEVRSLRLSNFRHSNLAFFGGVEAGLSNTFGLAYLARYIVTFDFPKKAVYLKPSRNFARRDCEFLRGTTACGLVLMRHSGEISIRNVFSGSAAARAGVKPQDILIAVDGTDVRVPRSSSIHTLFCGSSDTVRLTLTRAGRTIDATLKFPAKVAGEAGIGPIRELAPRFFRRR